MKKEFIVETDLNLRCVTEFTSAGGVSFKPHGELIRCKDCRYWSVEDGMFPDIDEREWHHCPHIGIDTDAYFYCREAERKEE